MRQKTMLDSIGLMAQHWLQTTRPEKPRRMKMTEHNPMTSQRFGIQAIPTFIMFTKFHWINTFKPLIVPAWFGEAYAIFLMRQFFRTIPKDLEEAAVVDGASRLHIIFRIIVPLSIPVLAVIGILSFKDIWNDFFGPLLYLNSTDKYTVSLGLAS